MTMIQFQNVFKKYPDGYDALRRINLDIQSGDFVFLTGHSGAGKTTLLKLIMLTEKATRGQIFVAGKELSKLSRRQMPFYRRMIGFVFQDSHLLLKHSVYDNVALPLAVSGFNYREIGKSVRAALDMVGLLGKEKRLPISLSAGEQQRVGIARAIINKPTLLLADEPTGNLDPGLSAEIMQLFDRLNQAGTTMLIASHDLALIAGMRHRIIKLRKGEIVTNGQD